ncbi:2OG-Fe(II) oxygenase [Brevundimonas sp. NPDC092305]|uniref:2OG-Fe(II) oxygenase n=1 Tax=Brevundimonas sp. NPDC092305 TaxID=3363957 RepID=UPI0037F586C4
MAGFQIGRHLDPATIGPVFRRAGRLHAPDFLDAGSAATLHEALTGATSWTRSLLLGQTPFTMTAGDWDALPDARRTELETGMRQQARTGFHYAFDTWPVSDEIEAGRRTGHPAEAFHDFLNGDVFLDWVRALTGDDRATYCDAQCTRYRPGDYLNAHTDEAEGKNRLFAYVMNLTPGWSVDRGGLLQFIDQDGHVAEAYTPAFNALNVFAVPAPHSVSMVTPFAGGDRLAITGWIRSSRPD